MLIFFSFGSHSKKPFTIFDVIIRVLSSRLHYKIPVEGLFLTVYLLFKLNKLEVVDQRKNVGFLYSIKWLSSEPWVIYRYQKHFENVLHKYIVAEYSQDFITENILFGLKNMVTQLWWVLNIDDLIGWFISLFAVIRCSDSPPPCLRGVCKDTAAGFVCDCPSKYSGRTCDTRK